jgi:hypothetical protein
MYDLLDRMSLPLSVCALHLRSVDSRNQLPVFCGRERDGANGPENPLD